MKQYFSPFLFTIAGILLILSSCLGPQNKKPEVVLGEYNFLVSNDNGRNGNYDQKPIAEAMGIWADSADAEFMAAVGDVHHYGGIRSTQDPLWMTNYELVYSQAALQLDWFPVLGNHEYRGNTQACIDYSQTSRRWNLKSRYYSFSAEVNDSTSICFVFIDTPPLIDKYRNDSTSYLDARFQDMNKQLSFIDSVLSQSNDTWKIVMGHHPIHAYTTKDSSERHDLQQRLEPILKNNKVDVYINGHIHNFQHIQKEGSAIDYIVNSSASLSRPVEEIEETQFCSPVTGFLVCGADHNAFHINMMNKNGECIYTYSRSKQ